ncbi:hypothetical protein Tco_0712572 [Tanacetum coccineum]
MSCPMNGANVEANLRGLVGLGKWALIFVILQFSSAPPEDQLQHESKYRVSEAVAGLVLPLCSLTRSSFVCQPKDSGPNQYTTCRVVLGFCSSGTAIVTPDMSFDIPASPGYVSSIGRASLAKAINCISPLEVSKEIILHHLVSSKHSRMIPYCIKG